MNNFIVSNNPLLGKGNASIQIANDEEEAAAKYLLESPFTEKIYVWDLNENRVFAPFIETYNMLPSVFITGFYNVKTAEKFLFQDIEPTLSQIKSAAQDLVRPKGTNFQEEKYSYWNN